MSKIIYDVYKSTNTKSTSYGKYFGRIIHTETLTTRKLAKHIAEHGSVYTQDVVEGVLTKAEACIVEQLLESKKIKLEGLGTFYLMAENKSGGAVSLEKFNPKTTLKGLHIRFLPDSSSESQLNSKDMLAKANFIWAEDLKRDSAEGRPTDGSSNGNGSQSGSNSGNGDNSGSGSQNSGSDNTGGNSGNSGNSGSVTPSVAAPTFSGATQFTESTQVTMNGPAGAEIRYTTNGSTPTAQSTLYTEPITLTETTTVKAIAIKDGQSSAVTSRTYSKVEAGGGGDDEPGGDDH